MSIENFYKMLFAKKISKKKKNFCINFWQNVISIEKFYNILFVNKISTICLTKYKFYTKFKRNFISYKFRRNQISAEIFHFYTNFLKKFYFIKTPTKFFNVYFNRKFLKKLYSHRKTVDKIVYIQKMSTKIYFYRKFRQHLFSIQSLKEILFQRSFDEI